MKKILPSIVLLSVVTVLFVPFLVSAADQPVDCCVMRRTLEIDGKSCADGTIVGPSGGTCAQGSINCVTEKWGIFCIINTIQTVVDWFFAVLVAVSVLLAIIGAFSILTAGGSPEKVSTGRGYILYAAIGLAVAFIARAVPSLVKGIMGF